MRLKSLHLDSFKNLTDFSIEFDKAALITVLLGQNGSGKSNLLEALVLIFRNLDLGSPPQFKYRISYESRGKSIEVRADPLEKSHTHAFVDGKEVRFRAFVDNPERAFLPKYVFGYYSGASDRLAAHFERHQGLFYRALIQPDARADNLPLRPLFYARLVHSQFVLLSFFIDPSPTTDAFLADYLSIIGLQSVTFVIKRPQWAHRQVNDEFWGAKGVVRSFLEQLRTLSHTVEDAAPTRSRAETVQFRIDGVAELRKLAAAYGTAANFFKTLESTYISDLLSEVRISVLVRSASTPLTFTELSEGEQQLLTVLGLLRFTSDGESLFLLDEPDTHLNPAWSIGYLDLLNRVVGPASTSNLLITTHDPLLVGGLSRSEVRILRKIDGGNVVADAPRDDPKGMGIDAILTELFGLRATVDPETMELLDRKRELAVKDSLTAPEAVELTQLSEQIGPLDFTSAVRDPLYRLFVDAVAKSDEYQKLRKPVLTDAEKQRQRELAERAIRRIRSEK